ncbi:hypothetical protein GDO78_004800 [Eleutherodactylus coqui]|uniref:Uncharacterized protein n=1 Tax=Eleutherodactylus coqui TaxID=57060 RepID=A0A8J6ET94_ELECQ|nr:hypothetical protein GDO78_004800 [Eleutherodactylus coqui]
MYRREQGGRPLLVYSHCATSVQVEKQGARLPSVGGRFVAPQPSRRMGGGFWLPVNKSSANTLDFDSLPFSKAATENIQQLRTRPPRAPTPPTDRLQPSATRPGHTARWSCADQQGDSLGLALHHL